MTIIDFIEGLDGVLALKPSRGDGTPELAWGDAFFYYSPDGTVPKTQPFATVVTKNYPDDEGSRLDRPGAFRVNVAAGTAVFTEWVGSKPREAGLDDVDFSVDDVVLPHPVYGGLGWLCVVNPGPNTESALRELLTGAYAAARTRHQRHAEQRSTQ
ncbi:MAG: DUF6194 family protein [Stackebrandtia sp.]